MVAGWCWGASRGAGAPRLVRKVLVLGLVRLQAACLPTGRRASRSISQRVSRVASRVNYNWKKVLAKAIQLVYNLPTDANVCICISS